MKLDILAFAAHPDDIELACGGTIISQTQKGRKVGIVDLTQGELGTRGTVEQRKVESGNASKILGIQVRENLDLGDGFFQNTIKEQMAVIKMIRKYKPDVIFANAVDDRHPDHKKGANLLKDAFFLSGLEKVVTTLNDDVSTPQTPQTPWRARILLHYIQSKWLQPDFVVDITETFDKKMEAIQAFTSQFYNPDSDEPETFISSKHFLELIRARAIESGNLRGFKYAEGFNMSYTPGVKDILQIF